MPQNNICLVETCGTVGGNCYTVYIETGGKIRKKDININDLEHLVMTLSFVLNLANFSSIFVFSNLS